MATSSLIILVSFEETIVDLVSLLDYTDSFCITIHAAGYIFLNVLSLNLAIWGLAIGVAA